jgi:hypothetical protein
LEDEEPYAYSLGIFNYWDLTQKCYRKLVEFKRQEKIEQFNNNMALAWETARLVGIAFNNPKEFPRKPYQYEETEPKKPQTREESLAEWSAYCKANS